METIHPLEEFEVEHWVWVMSKLRDFVWITVLRRLALKGREQGQYLEKEMRSGLLHL